MVNKSLRITLAGIILVSFSMSTLNAQSKWETYPALLKYYKWGIITGPVLYDKAKIYKEYGDYSFDNKNTLSFNAGFEYDFYPDKRISFMSGFFVSLEPVYNFSYIIKKEDIYPQYTDDWVDKDKMYALTSFSSPLLIRLRVQASKDYYFDFLTGLRIMFFPSGSADFLLVFHNKDDTESREVFGLRAESPENMFQGSFIIGTGISLAMKRVFFKTRIIYVMNFQNIMQGEYLFDNMFVSERTYGIYKLSGNYIGLLFTLHLAKNR